MKKFYKIFAAAALILLATGCGIYSFSGTSIAPDVKSITVHTIENKIEILRLKFYKNIYLRTGRKLCQF